MSASACFESSHFILIKGRSLPDLLDVILSASAWVIVLNSNSSLKSSIVTFVDTPLNTKIVPFVAFAECYDLGSDTFTFFPKTCCIFGSLCMISKSLGVSPMKIQPFLDGLSWETLRLGWYCLSSLMILNCVLSPCIMCVQYIGGMFNTSGGVQYIGGYHEYIGGYHEYIGGCSVHRGDIMMNVGDTKSTSGDVQYIGRDTMSTSGDIMSTSGDVQCIGGIS